MSSAATPSSRPNRPGRSLAFRVTAYYMLVFVVSVAALSAFAISATRAAAARVDTVVLESRVQRHVAILATGLPSYRAAVEQAGALGEPDAPVRVRAADGSTVYEHGDVAAARVMASRSTGSLRLEVGAPAPPWPALLDELRPGALIAIVGALLLAVAGGYALTRRGLRPVRQLAATAREVIHSGDLSRRVPEPRTRDELAEVSTLFNGVLARNEQLVAGMRASLDNVAHDLRTPLTRLRGTAEIALRGDEAAAREALATCIEESDHVLAMLRALMDISEAEAGIMKLAREPLGLHRVAREVVELYEQVAEDAGVELVADVHGADLVVLADPIRARQAVANLVDNAVKYTPRGGRVTLGVRREGERGVLAVVDTGEGIESGAQPRIFDRLFRAEPSRSRPGLGLGLSLVKAIADAHGGTIHVVSAPGQGSTFELALPLAPPLTT